MRVDEEGLVLREDILRELGIGQQSLLDIGVGPLAVIAAEEFGCQVTTIDSSSGAARAFRDEVRRRDLAGRVRVELADASAMPFHDNEFDVAVSYGALHHTRVDRRAQCVREMIRVVRQLVVIAELTKPGFRKLHGESALRPVSSRWLAGALARQQATVIHRSEKMFIFVARPIEETAGAHSEAIQQ